MSEPPRMSGEAFALERLRDNPHLDYETLRQQAEREGTVVQPIQYGRARRQLGLTGAAPAAARAEASDAATAADAKQATGTTRAAEASQSVEVSQPFGDSQLGGSQLGGSQLEDSQPVGAPQLDAAPPPSQQIPPPTLAGNAGENPTPPASSQPTAAPKPGLTRKSTPAFEFLVESLQADPTVAYGVLKTRAEAAGLKIAPIMYGRAKALLGLVPVRPRGQGKNRKNRPEGQTIATLKPAVASSPDQFSEQLERVRNVDDLVRIVKLLDGERRRLRTLLEQIADSIDAALGYDDES